MVFVLKASVFSINKDHWLSDRTTKNCLRNLRDSNDLKRFEETFMIESRKFLEHFFVTESYFSFISQRHAYDKLIDLLGIVSILTLMFIPYNS